MTLRVTGLLPTFTRLAHLYLCSHRLRKQCKATLKMIIFKWTTIVLVALTSQQQIDQLKDPLLNACYAQCGGDYTCYFNCRASAIACQERYRDDAYYFNQCDDFATACENKCGVVPIHCYTTCKACQEKDFLCKNSECINEIYVCDEIRDCRDGSDEEDCSKVVKDTCNSPVVCDVTNYCKDMTAQDDSKCHIGNQRNGQCARPENKTCIYDLDKYHMIRDCRDGSHLKDCGDFECPPSHSYKCPTEHRCIPEQLKCNGFRDCPNGEDEQNCDWCFYPTMYKCRDSSVCSIRCNGSNACPEGDDDLFCSANCPEGCTCRDIGIMCNAVELLNSDIESLIERFDPSEREYLKLTNIIKPGSGQQRSGSNVLRIMINVDFLQLRTADFSDNGIKDIPSGTFQNQANMTTLVLNGNEIERLRQGDLNGLTGLQFLYMNNNGLKSIDEDAFVELAELQILDISSNQIEELGSGTFRNQTHLRTLDMSDNLIAEIQRGTFGNQANLITLVLTRNNIKVLTAYAFNGLKRLEILYMNENGLLKIEDNAFDELKSSLRYLQLKDNDLRSYKEDTFRDFARLQTLYSDVFQLCCTVGDIDYCEPVDQFASCKDLLKNEVLRILMLILGIYALIG